MAKAREPKVFRSMDDLPLMLTGLFTATDLRSIVGEPDKEVKIPVLSLSTQEVKGFKVPAFVQSDTLKITKL